MQSKIEAPRDVSSNGEGGSRKQLPSGHSGILIIRIRPNCCVFKTDLKSPQDFSPEWDSDQNGNDRRTNPPMTEMRLAEARRPEDNRLYLQGAGIKGASNH